MLLAALESVGWWQLQRGLDIVEVHNLQSGGRAFNLLPAGALLLAPSLGALECSGFSRYMFCATAAEALESFFLRARVYGVLEMDLSSRLSVVMWGVCRDDMSFPPTHSLSVSCSCGTTIHRMQKLSIVSTIYDGRGVTTSLPKKVCLAGELSREVGEPPQQHLFFG